MKNNRVKVTDLLGKIMSEPAHDALLFLYENSFISGDSRGFEDLRDINIVQLIEFFEEHEKSPYEFSEEDEININQLKRILVKSEIYQHYKRKERWNQI